MDDAELILYNADVLTLHPARPRARQVAVRGGRVLAVGGGNSMGGLRGAHTLMIDCRGRTLVPAFHDAHCHLVAFAESLLAPGLDWAAVRSIADIQQRVRRLAKGLPPGSWVRAGSYDEFRLAEKRQPTRRELDEAAGNHPVTLVHRSGHAHVLNSPALALAGITAGTPEPPGGMIERDLTSGEPNGLLYGMGAWLEKVVPPLDDAELERGIASAGERLLSLGVTAVQDASPHNGLRRWRQFRQWQERGLLKPQVSMMWAARALDDYPETPQNSSSHLRAGAVKIMLDETRGCLNPPQEELNRLVFEAHRAGRQVALHAVEESAIEAACAAMEYALRRLPRRDHRHRVEHCSVCPPALAKKLAALGGVVVTQPAFVYYHGDRYLQTVPPRQRQHLYPLATLLRAGIRAAAGSDCPVAPPDPLKGIRAAVCRRTEAGRDLLPAEHITPLEALQLYTGGAAYAAFDETERGCIAPGRQADLVLLSANPLEAAAEEMAKLSVEMTIMGGEVVWQKGGL